ncbi:MAG: hypothetical protein AAF687_03390 [Pseudomonadota bacterium]
MADRTLFKRPTPGGDPAQGEDKAAPEHAPLGGTNAEAMQRLQIGIFGLFSMVMVVGIATVISNRAQIAEETAVPDAAATAEPDDTTTQSDPLIDAGVVPDIPEETVEEPEAEPTSVPDIGETDGPARPRTGDQSEAP